MEEGELIPRKESKQQKMAKDPRDRRGLSVESRDEAEYVDLSGLRPLD